MYLALTLNVYHEKYNIKSFNYFKVTGSGYSFIVA